jgi:hypothetical protein
MTDYEAPLGERGFIYIYFFQGINHPLIILRRHQMPRLKRDDRLGRFYDRGYFFDIKR